MFFLLEFLKKKICFIYMRICLHAVYILSTYCLLQTGACLQV